jgi:hypothetical protein
MTTSIAGDTRTDPEDLICPACTRLVRPEPPSPSRVEDQASEQGWSHLDGSGLCSQLTGELAEPVVRGRHAAGIGRGAL